MSIPVRNGWGRSPGAWPVVYVWLPSLKESGADCACESVCEGVVECAVAGLGWGTVGGGHWGWVYAHGRESVAILRAVLLFGHAPHLIWLDMFAAMSNTIVIRIQKCSSRS